MESRCENFHSDLLDLFLRLHLIYTESDSVTDF